MFEIISDLLLPVLASIVLDYSKTTFLAVKLKNDTAGGIVIYDVHDPQNKFVDEYGGKLAGSIKKVKHVQLFPDVNGYSTNNNLYGTITRGDIHIRVTSKLHKTNYSVRSSGYCYNHVSKISASEDDYLYLGNHQASDTIQMDECVILSVSCTDKTLLIGTSSKLGIYREGCKTVWFDISEKEQNDRSAHAISDKYLAFHSKIRNVHDGKVVLNLTRPFIPIVFTDDDTLIGFYRHNISNIVRVNIAKKSQEIICRLDITKDDREFFEQNNVGPWNEVNVSSKGTCILFRDIGVALCISKHTTVTIPIEHDVRDICFY